MAFLPSVLALITIQLDARQLRDQRAADRALSEARLLSADMDSLIDGSRQMALAVAQFDSVRALSPDCGVRLAALQQEMGSATALAVVAGDGRALCGRAPATLPDLGSALSSGGFTVGHYAARVGADPVLPMIMPFVASDGRHAAVVASLSLDWLARHVARFHARARNSLNVADAAGTLLVRLPNNETWRGHEVVSPARALLHAAGPGSTGLTGLDGLRRIVGYVPAGPTAALYVSFGIYAPDVVAAGDRAAERGYVLVGVAAALSLLLMLVITHRLVRAPTEALLQAARRWSRGDLAARANLAVPPGNEFGRLAAAFNSMAEALGRQRREVDALNVTLEARIEDRTRSVSRANDRLLIEMAERARADAALRRAQKLQAVGQLAGGMAHEFNNLLTAVIGGLDLLLRRLPADEKLRQCAETAMLAARRGGRLTSQLLAFSRARRLASEAVDLNAAIGGMAELITSTVGCRCKLVMNLAADCGAALADRNEIEAALLNLVLNARDAMPEGGTLQIATVNTAFAVTEASVAAESGGAFVEIVVADTGVGMSAEQLGHAVDPFFTTKAPGQGAGLGLSQVHGMAQQLGGELRIESRVGAGTVVRLLLPRAPDAAGARLPMGSPIGSPMASPVLLPARRRGLLLVDDDAQVREIAAEMLSELGYDVAVARDGAEALCVMEQRRACPIEILVADYAMPGMSGLQVIGAARRRCPDLVAMLITGYADFDRSDAAGLITDRQIMRKPFTLGELAKRIDELVA